ncbi:glycosyltransferase [Olsenella sp. Marseille-P4559]|uniref:glycosyltransferase n=1 Tax=Olsenella sp. Marseille-P4559 TaxID=2364795 RepID=UPI0013EF03D0|nr:glycosyltransferase [Olsenella sp. Marseille-P4559]
MPLVSIVVPAYNVEDYIGACLRSLLSQTLRDIEVICVDDASTDGTSRIVQELAKSDSRLHYVRNERNLNLFATRHVGVARTTGTYVTFVDADDELVPEACERLVDQMSRDEVDILHFGVRVVAEPRCDEKTVAGIERTMNPTERKLEGKAILSTCFLDWSYDYNLNHKLYRGDLVRRVLGGLGLTPGISAAEDVVEYFAVAREAQTYRAVSPSAYYVYHIGRGQTGAEGISPAGFSRSSKLKRRCCDVLSDYLMKTGALADATVSRCLESVSRHELEHTMNVWQDEVPLEVRRETLETVLGLWDEHDVARELYRFLRDDAYGVAHGEMDQARRARFRERLEVNKVCLEESVPQSQLWEDAGELDAMRQSARIHYDEFLDVVLAEEGGFAESASQIMAAGSQEERCARLDAVLSHGRPDQVFSAIFGRIFEDGRFEAISTLQGARSLAVSRRSVHTIALYYFQLAGGGAEAVTISLARMFLSEGYQVVLLCDVLPSEGTIPAGTALVRLPDFRSSGPSNYLRRAHVLEEALVRHGVDVLVYSQWLSHCLEWDQFVTKALGIAFVVHTHGSFTNLVDQSSEDELALPVNYRLSDAVVCLDQLDAEFWRQFNPRVFTTVNQCSISTKATPQAALSSHDVIWVGRLSAEEKRPEDAIRIIARVRETVPDARLLFVGPGEESEVRLLHALAESEGVSDAIEFLGARKDVPELMLRSSVHLMTSPSEGFPLAVAESKACGVPCVMYELPIRFSREARGLVSVPQGGVDAAAQKTSQLLRDDALRKAMGDEARRSAEELEAFDIDGLWKRILEASVSDHPVLAGSNGLRREMQEVLCGVAYAKVLARNRELHERGEKIDELERRVSELGSELSSLQSSRTYRAGEAIAGPIRAFRRIVGEGGK